MQSEDCASCAASYSLIPFGICIFFSLTFSVTYLLYYWKTQERDRFCFIVSIMALFVTSVSVFILPVDVFLVSYMKNPDGTFKEWVNNATEASIKDSVSYVYYGIYSVILVLAFFLLPLAYFAHEEKADGRDTCFRIICALRYTSVFFLFAAIFIIIGAFFPYGHLHIPRNQTENLTSWEQIELVFSEIEKNRGYDALIFVLNVLVFAGMLGAIIYTAFGMSSFTIGNIRGWRSRAEEREAIINKKEELERKIMECKNKDESFVNACESQSLQLLEEEYQFIINVEKKIQLPTPCFFRMCNNICFSRGCTFVGGVVGAGFGVVLWMSLFIVNLEKAIWSFGFKSGYFIESLKWFNPLNFIMVQISKVFPLDYVLYFCMIIFLIFCTVSGLRYAGICCFGIRMFKVRPQRTEPQALIMLCGILIYVMLALNILMYEVMPQYTTFGNQHYQIVPANHTNVTKIQILQCDFTAPKGECVMTRASNFIISLSVKASFFASIYYYFTWIFLIAVIMGFFVMVGLKKKSIVDDKMDEDDFIESDEDDEGPIVA